MVKGKPKVVQKQESIDEPAFVRSSTTLQKETKSDNKSLPPTAQTSITKTTGTTEVAKKSSCCTIFWEVSDPIRRKSLWDKVLF